MKNKELVELLISKNISISSIESYTGGLFASKLVEIPGSSKTFLGSLVSYSTLIKENVLKVNKETIDTYNVVSKEVAEEMVIKGKEMFLTDIVVSFTGNAGPSFIKDSTLGLCFISILFKDKIITFKKEYKNLSRNEIREDSVNFIIEELLKLLK